MTPSTSADATTPAKPATEIARQARKTLETPAVRRDAPPPPVPSTARENRPDAGPVSSDAGPNGGPATHDATAPLQGQPSAESSARTISETGGMSVKSDTSGAQPASGASAESSSGAGWQAGTPGAAQRSGPAGGHGSSASGGTGPFGYAVHDVDVRPAVRRRVAPEYPDQARRTGTQGRVVLRLLVDEHGHARHVSVLEATPDGIFEQCALDAVIRWSFTPGKRDGKAVPTWVLLPLRFDLATR